MPENDKIILKTELIASSKGVVIDRPYRAILKKETSTFSGVPKMILAIEQQIKDHWSGTPGQWYLSTLLESALTGRLCDGIPIDAGQLWQVDSGLKAALLEAVDYI